MSLKNKLLGSNHSLSQKARLVILFLAVILLLVNLWQVDFDQLLSRDNVGEGFGILSNLFLIAAMAVSMKYSANQKEIKK